MIWSDRHVALLTGAHRIGTPAREIALILGCPRSEVFAKIVELGLLRPDIAAVVVVDVPVVIDGFVPLELLTDEICKWPVIGDGADMRFCGKKRHGVRYCEAHDGIAYQRSPRARGVVPSEARP